MLKNISLNLIVNSSKTANIILPGLITTCTSEIVSRFGEITVKSRHLTKLAY